MNTILYTTLIKAYSKTRNLNKVIEILNLMIKSNNAKPNIITYNIVIDCCIKCGNYDLAYKYYYYLIIINTDNNMINLILVVTVSNNYNYLQRKIIEKIIQTQIFPVNKGVKLNNSFYENNNMTPNNRINKNKKKLNLYSGYTIILKDIKIENGSSIAALSLFKKIKLKHDTQTIAYDNSDKNYQNDNNDKNKISTLISNYDERTSNNTEYYSNTLKSKDSKGRDSTNSINKSKNISLNNKNILVINVDGGFTNISLANISQNKPKEKEKNTKPKNAKNIKKNFMNILEIKELSGNEYGEEDFIDMYINDCLKHLEENIYKECLKSPNELARLRHSIIVAKKYFNSMQKDNTLEVNLPHQFFDIKININKNNYEKSCQEMFTKIITMIKNILKKSKLSEKNIDIIIIISSKITANKINIMLKNIFPNSKILYKNCNNYIVTGATMQALNNNMIKPLYKFIDITNMNFGIETLNGFMDIIIPRGLKLPVQKIKYVKIKSNDGNNTENSNHLNKYLEINIFEGDNKYVKNNRLISCANIDKRNFKEENIGEGYIELLVEFEINNYSCLSVYVLDIKNFQRRFECLTNLDMVKG